jgi:hypothetical protein
MVIYLGELRYQWYKRIRRGNMETKQIYTEEDQKQMTALRDLTKKIDAGLGLADMQGLEQALKGDVTQKNYQIARLQTIGEGYQVCDTYASELGVMTAGLSQKLAKYNEFMDKVATYEGSEKIWKFVWKSRANNLRDERLKTQTPEASLKTIITYHTEVVRELMNVRKAALKQYEGLAATVELCTKKLELSEPKVAVLKEKLDALNNKYKELEDQSKTADAKTRVSLETQMKDLKQTQMIPLQAEYDEWFMMFKTANELLEPNKIQRDNHASVVQTFAMAAAQMNQIMENSTNLLLSGAKARRNLEIAESIVDTNQVVRAGIEKSLVLGSQMKQVVQDKMMGEAQKEAVQAEVVKTLLDKLKAETAQFDADYAKVEARAHATVQERYEGAKQ